MNNDTIFKVENVYKKFGDSPDTEVIAVNDVSLEIEKGEFTALVGPSGSGKTTLLNLMSGLDNPTSGSIYLKGSEISSMSGSELSDFRRDHIGFIFQSYNLIPVLTVLENIEYILVLQGIDKFERKRRVLEMLEIVGLNGFENRLPTQLSGGQQQRVAVARAIVSRPDIILADEPTANLDSRTGEELVEMMHSLNREFETTFVFSTHDPIIMNKAARLITLHDGKIVSDEIR